MTAPKGRVSEPATGDRFPGFNVLDQAGHWDPVTAGVVLSRVGRPPDIRFFTPAEEAAATALCDRLLGQDGEPKVAVVPQIDTRLAEQETDGWRYADMPEDGQAWRESLRFLDEDSQAACSREFARASVADQRAVIQAVQDLGREGVARPERRARLEPVDAVRVHRVLRPSLGVERDRVSRPRLSARLQESRRGRPGVLRGRRRHPVG